MTTRYVDTAAWPIHPTFDNVAVEVVGSDPGLGLIVAVGPSSEFGLVAAGRLCVVRPVQNRLVVTISGRQFAIVEDREIVALLPPLPDQHPNAGAERANQGA